MTFRTIDIGPREAIQPNPGPAPMLQWLPIGAMRIDEDYQRPLLQANWKAINTIAANFQWSRFAPVLCAPVAGGFYAVIDGQHRLHAAALCGIAEVPAMVVQVGLTQQAQAFAWVNSQSIRVSAFHILKAALAAGEDWATRADAAVTAGGGTLMQYHASSSLKKAGQVYCVTFIRRQIEAGHDRAITAALRALRAVERLDTVASFNEYLLGPWVLAVAEERCLDHARLVRALEARNPFKVVEDAVTVMGRRDALRKMIIRAGDAA